jgi:Domain of unknown function (DUF4279)
MMNTSSRRTPIDDGYASCRETRVELLIYPGKLSPDEVTARLGLEPTQVNLAGSEVTNRLGRTRTIQINGWFLSSEGQIESLDARRHLDWLLTVLRPKDEALQALQAAPDVQMSVNCTWISRSGHGGPTLWPEQMRALAELSLECSFDIGFYEEDEN